MKRRVFALVLTVIMALSLAAPALAYTTPDFSDVPSNHWAYEAVMKMADAGVIKGTGNGQFSPDMKLSAEMFVVLVGRVVFPEVKADGADWSGPYITEAKAKGLLTGTNVTDANIKGDISRYDMAVILAKCVEILKVSATKADSSKVADYGDIPNRYTDAVLMAYGSGLIRGDQNGSFNGQNSMTRQEAATVMDRLLGLKGGNAQGATTAPEKPEETEKPTEPTEELLVTYYVTAWVRTVDHAIGRPRDDKRTNLPSVPVKLYYTPDGGKTSILVAEATTPTQAYIDKYHNTTDISFEAPESWSSYTSYKNGGGFYFSAETVLDGQRLVTSDLRTDGRAYKNIIRLTPGEEQWQKNYWDVELTPPHGEKAKFTYQGHIVLFGSGYIDEPLPGFTIQLHLADGRIVAETVSQADGSFSMECEVDALDGGFDHEGKYYYTTASGYFKGERYERSGKYIDSDAFILENLIAMNVVDDYGLPRQRADDTITITQQNKKQ